MPGVDGTKLRDTLIAGLEGRLPGPEADRCHDRRPEDEVAVSSIRTRPRATSTSEATRSFDIWTNDEKIAASAIAALPAPGASAAPRASASARRRPRRPGASSRTRVPRRRVGCRLAAGRPSGESLVATRTTRALVLGRLRLVARGAAAAVPCPAPCRVASPRVRGRGRRRRTRRRPWRSPSGGCPSRPPRSA